jgi:polyisoprenyl-teichoic acid--peptidoglycan teichoic acid transferase
VSADDRDRTPPSGEEPIGPEDQTGLTDEFERVLGEGEQADPAEEPAEPAAEPPADEPQPPDPEPQDEEALEVEESEEAEREELLEAAVAGAEDPDLARQRLVQETVEADVLALGDAEEAAEQAAVEQGTDDEPIAVAPEPEEADVPETEAEEEEDGADEDSGETAERGALAAARARLAGRSKPPPKAPESPKQPVAAASAAPDEDDKPPKARLWLRFVAAAFVIVVSMATATSVTGLLYLTDLAKGLGGLDNVRNQLEQVQGGEPQNILILGSDERPDDPSARSDTTMLVRLDPDQDAIALFSLPRDLQVNIPGHGVDRLNAAYTYGGPKLTLETVKQVTGLKIHHVVNVDFNGFYAAVNAIDCVYVDVDRSYYVPPEAEYAEINIPAGYQLLCGERALQYVRFRHADTDITRTARQQDFLREARQKISPARIFRDREELIDIFKKYTTSDIEEAGVMLDVLKLFLSVADAPVKEIHFEGNIGPSYITFSQEQMQKAVDQFLGLEDTEGPRGGGALNAPEEPEGDGGGGGGGGGEGDGGGGEPEPNLIDSSGFGRGVGEELAGKVDFPVYYPTRLTQGAQFSGDTRAYKIEAEDGKIHDIYKIVIQTPLLGEYYGVSGTTWEDPPILANPSETREIGGRDFDLFYDGDRLRLVAWHTDKASYWLNNSLLQSIDEAEMLEIAETMEDVAPTK